MTHPGELISAYLDGELDREEVLELLGHLAGCGRCASEMNDMQTVRSAVRSLPMVELPSGLMGNPTRDVVPLRRNRGFLAGAAAAVVAAAITVAALITPPPQPVSVEDLNSRFGARVSLDPAFGPAKIVVPEIVEVAG